MDHNRHAKGTTMHCMLLMCVVLLCAGCYRSPTVPKSVGSRYFGVHGWIFCEFANPRNVGPVYYVEHHDPTGGGIRSYVRTGASDVEEHDYRVATIPFVRLRSGECVVAWMQEPYIGHEGLREADRIVPPIVCSAGDADVPMDADVVSVVLLLSARDEDTGWRYFETGPLGPTQVVKRDSHDRPTPIKVPDLTTLPRLEDRPDGAALWKMFQEANAAFRTAGGKHYATTPKSLQ